MTGSESAAREAGEDVGSMVSSSESPLLSSITASDNKLPSKDYRWNFGIDVVLAEILKLY